MVRIRLPPAASQQTLDPLALFLELQYRFMHQYLDTLIENSVALVRAVRRTADETLGPLEQQLQQRRSARQDEGKAHRQAAE